MNVMKNMYQIILFSFLSISFAQAQLYFFSSYYFKINTPPQLENAEKVIVSFAEGGVFNVNSLNVFSKGFEKTYQSMVLHHQIKKSNSDSYVLDCINNFKLKVQLYYACPVARVSYRARGNDFDANKISAIYKKYKTLLHKTGKSWDQHQFREKFAQDVSAIYPWLGPLASSFGLSIYNLQRCRSEDGAENALMKSAGMLTEVTSRSVIAREFHVCYKQVFGYN